MNINSLQGWFNSDGDVAIILYMLKKIFRSTFTILFLSLLCMVPAAAEEIPDFKSTYVYLIDANSEQVFYEKNSTEIMYPASMTKMMAELLVIESFRDRMDETVEITPQMLEGLAESNASVAGYAIGDRPTIKDLLYGCALPSGADCIRALAIASDGSVSSFVSRMNRKAAELGMTHTHFTNASGLHDPDHYTTCQDLSVLLKACLKEDLFRTVSGTDHYLSSPVYSAPSGIAMKSTTYDKIKESGVFIPGFLGGKTGFTNAAGRCLASFGSLNGIEVLMISGQADGLGAIEDAAKAYQWISADFSRKTLIEADQPVVTVPVLEAKGTDTVTLVPRESFAYNVSSSDTIEFNHVEKTDLVAPISPEEPLGTLSVLRNGEIIKEIPLHVKTAVSVSIWKKVLRKLIAFRIWIALFFAAVILSNLLNRRRKRRRRRRRKINRTY